MAGFALLAVSLFAAAAHATTEITYSDGGTLALGGSGAGTITGYGGDLAVAVNGRTVARAHLAPASSNAASPRAVPTSSCYVTRKAVGFHYIKTTQEVANNPTFFKATTYQFYLQNNARKDHQHVVHKEVSGCAEGGAQTKSYKGSHPHLRRYVAGLTVNDPTRRTVSAAWGAGGEITGTVTASVSFGALGLSVSQPVTVRKGHYGSQGPDGGLPHYVRDHPVSEVNGIWKGATQYFEGNVVAAIWEYPQSRPLSTISLQFASATAMS